MVGPPLRDNALNWRHATASENAFIGRPERMLKEVDEIEFKTINSRAIKSLWASGPRHLSIQGARKSGLAMYRPPSRPYA